MRINKQIKIWILLSVFISFSGFLQAAEGNKKIDKLKSKGLAKYDNGEYQLALVDLLEADSLSPGDALVEYTIGVCYLNSPFPSHALEYIERSDLHGSHDPYLQYYFGKADHINHLFDDAVVHYQKFLEVLNKDYFDYEEKEFEVKNLIVQCATAKELVKDTLQIVIRNLGSVVNSEYSEYVPVISADESTLFFTSRRPHAEDAKRDKYDNHFYEDIYYSKRIGEDWSEPKIISNKLNTTDHDACIGVSADGQQLFIYKSRKSSHGISGDIWVSHLEGEEWGAPVKLGENVNTKGWEPSATISSDGKKLFFTSNREGGFGGTDIYESDLGEDGEWGKAFNLGPNVNTEYDEDAPFIHADNKTLFFSSNGPKSMGGFDVFVSLYHFEDSTWSEPINIGYPINTASHDIYMVWNAARTHGYFATYRHESHGMQDLYVLERPFEEAHLVLLKGFVSDNIDGNPVAANIEIIDLETNEIVGEYNSNQIDGRYSLTLPHGKNYSITVETEGYLFYSKNVHIPEHSHYHEVIENIVLQKIYVEEQVVVASNEEVKRRKEITTRKKAESEQDIVGDNEGVTDLSQTDQELITKEADVVDNSLSESDRELIAKDNDLVENKLSDDSSEDLVNTDKNIDVVENSKGTSTNEDVVNNLTDASEEEIVSDGQDSNVEEQTVTVLNNGEKEKIVIKEPVVSQGIKITLNNIFFDTDKSELRSTSFAELNNVYKLLSQHEDLFIEISGHTDDKATHKYNQILSERRAFAVVQYLVDKGINAHRLVAVGYSETMPIASNNTEDGRQQNRRTELKLIREIDIANYSNRVTGLNKMIKHEKGDKANKARTYSYYKFSTKNKMKPSVGQILSLKVHFLFDNYDYITDYSKGQVEKVIYLLEQHPDLKLRIHAHADPFGSAIYNQELSEKRAGTVHQYLLSLGVDPSRLEISTYGEDVLLVNSEDAAENLLNRRVEFEVIQ